MSERIVKNRLLVDFETERLNQLARSVGEVMAELGPATPVVALFPSMSNKSRSGEVDGRWWGFVDDNLDVDQQEFLNTVLKRVVHFWVSRSEDSLLIEGKRIAYGLSLDRVARDECGLINDLGFSGAEAEFIRTVFAGVQMRPEFVDEAE